MELYERELGQAQQVIADAGRDTGDFTFKMSVQPPDPDGGGMFTVRYDVIITQVKTAKSLSVVGGIGLRWVEEFKEALAEGDFD